MALIHAHLAFLITTATLLSGKLVWATTDLQHDPNDEKLESHSGSSTRIITESERAAFHITDDELKTFLTPLHHVMPTDVFVRSPTPWNDLYKRYNWPQVSRTITCSNITKHPLQSSTVVLTSNMCINPSTITNECSVLLAKNASISATHTRPQPSKLNLHEEIDYKIFSDFFSEAVNYKTPWTGKYEKVIPVLIQPKEPITFSLGPGESAEVQMIVNRNLKTVDVTYNASLHGFVAMNYYFSVDGHHFWPYGVENFLSRENLVQFVSETITFEFFTDCKIKVFNINSKKIIKEYSC